MVFKKKERDVYRKVISLLYDDSFPTCAGIASKLGVNLSSFNRSYWKVLKVHGVIVKHPTNPAQWIFNKQKAISFMDAEPCKVVLDESGAGELYKENTLRSHYYGFRLNWFFPVDNVALAERLGFKQGKPHKKGVWWDFPKKPYRSVSFILGHWNVQLTNHCVVAILDKEHSLYGEKSFENDLHAIYLWRDEVITVLERGLGKVLSRKDRDGDLGYDLKFSNTSKHHARVHDFFASTLKINNKDFKVYVDGQLRLLVDNSHGVGEFESVHKKFSSPDDEIKNKFFADLVGTSKITFSDVNKALFELATAQKKTHGMLQYLDHNLLTHKEAIEKIGVGVEDMSGNIIEFTGVMKEFKDSVVTKKSSLLESIKQKIFVKSDLFKFDSEIRLLSAKDKKLLVTWYMDQEFD